MYCQNCGKENEDTAKFCVFCGSKIDELSEIETIGAGMREQGSEIQPTAQPCLAPAEQAQEFKAPKMPKLSKGALILIGEAVAVVAVAIGLVQVAKNSCSPEQVAKQHFVKIANQEWDKVYDEMGWKESTFITRENYRKVHEQPVVKDVRDYRVDDTVDNLEKLFGEQGRDCDALVEIYYEKKDSQDEQLYQVKMKKDGKKWLFFPKYRVISQDEIAKDVGFFIPEGAKLMIDGIEVTNEYKVEEEEDGDYYRIPEIFAGNHTIEITKEGYEPQKEERELYTGTEVSASGNMQYTEEVRRELIRLAGEDMKKIYAAATSGKNFNAIKDLFTEEVQDDMEESYNYLMKNLNEDTYHNMKKIEFKNIEGSIEPGYSSVDISLEYKVTYTYEDWFDNNKKKEGVEEGDANGYFNFEQQDGKWLLTSLGCPGIYY